MKALNKYIIILLTPMSLFCQDNFYRLDTSYAVTVINRDTINDHFTKLDIRNSKFKSYIKRTFSRLNKKYPRKVHQTEIKKETEITYELKLEGEYSNGQRTGTWIYWSGSSDPNSQCTQYINDKTVEYKSESIKLKTYSFVNEQEIAFNSDSSVINGKIKLMQVFNLTLSCANEQCLFSKDSIEIARCSIKDWEKRLEEISIDYEIKTLTKKRKN